MAEWASSVSSSWTDSLRIRVSGSGGSASTAELLKQLEEFGEVCRVELVDTAGSPGGGGGEGAAPGERAALVSFFDVRAAQQAQEALGDLCSAAPSHGHRTLRLLGGATLEAANAEEVANIVRTEEGDFLLEFFDVRVAARVATTAYAGGGETKAKIESGCCAAEEATAAPATDVASLGQRPASSGSNSPAQSARGPRAPEAPRSREGALTKKLASRMCTSQLNWGDLAAKRELRTTLLLRGLPKGLCDVAAFLALLRSNGINVAVKGMKELPSRGRSLGCALVEVGSIDDVPKVARFLHGRQFGGGLPVAVSFAPSGLGRGPAAAKEARSGCCGSGADGAAALRPPGLGMAQPPPGLEWPPGLAAKAA